ncbi:MAG: hypothetical protein ACTSYD_10960 [Candidatus Heimdallarchaeaceae archaeon]
MFQDNPLVQQSSSDPLYCVVYFGDNGFDVFATNIDDYKLLISLQHYPTLLSMLQGQSPKGLATTKISDNLFLFAYVINIKNPLAKDTRLHKSCTTVINFLVDRETYRHIMLYFDDFEDFLADYFSPIRFLSDLYAIDFTSIIPLFTSTRYDTPKQSADDDQVSIATEFKRWLADISFEETFSST